jgi:hypothetical protein
MCTTHLILFVLAARYRARTALDPEGDCLTLIVSGVNGMNCNRISITVAAAAVKYRFVIISVEGGQGRKSK